MDSCESCSPFQLSGLPVEVVEQVLSWVHPRAANQLRLLSRSFNICLSSRSFWVKNLLRFPPDLSKHTFQDCQMINFMFFPVGYQQALASLAGDIITTINGYRLLEGKTANIPKCINQFSLLNEFLIMGANTLGVIPKEVGDLTNLKVLSLEGNHLTGKIPDSLGCLLNCERLNLADNRLTGMIPDSLGNLLKLKDLDLHKNQLTGQIPPSIGSLILLENLFLSKNLLTGPIPESLGSLVQLRSFFLNQNRLTGKIPENFSELRQLKYFVFDKASDLILSPVLECRLLANGVTDRFTLLNKKEEPKKIRFLNETPP